MRLLVQRVKEASVTVNGKISGQVGPGLLVFLGVHKNDTPDNALWLINKLVTLRIFPNELGKMHHSVQEVKGDILVVSQFTLYGDCESGRRPDFQEAALPEHAFLLYEQFVSELSKSLGKNVATGVFGALMEVASINDGPLTFLIEK